MNLPRDAAGGLKSQGRASLLRIAASTPRATIARTVGVGRSELGYLLAGRNLPSLSTAFAIERAYGIPARDWLIEPESIVDCVEQKPQLCTAVAS